ncbi:hypothetical protein HU675_0038220 [Bradyrhizobium septentrionale]|uniref:hypothetical protein n=1 Tax=Bradyrhizobium septentrionale TaxID=1404411 RepID=UPI00159716D5|nr:hypothetical protein [Bradyrhizobium septentrionale]UGY23723.1 hypothetical protein HU675_0038220 [Bradyrhizobium septentrionale]
MNHVLVIIHEFGNYLKGQLVTEVSEIEQILASHNHVHVNKVAGTPTNAAAAAPAPAAPVTPAPATSAAPAATPASVQAPAPAAASSASSAT